MGVENKTQVKNRMIKKAASLWGVQPNEIESTFDPIVTLLINVLLRYPKYQEKSTILKLE